MMKIEHWLTSSIKLLEKYGVENARLDCLILLEDVLHMNRSLILSHQENQLNPKQINQLSKMLDQRKNRIPLAYIRKYKEFYGLDFDIDKNVLIPRPETEEIIEIFKKLSMKQNNKIADIGTGSGVIAITIAKLYPKLQIDAFDINKLALKIAEKNISKHKVNVNLSISDLLDNVNGPYDVIIANLPYVNLDKIVSKELSYEPKIAIFTEENGFKLIDKLLSQINPNKLVSKGLLILESDKEQHSQIAHTANKHYLSLIETSNLIQVFRYLPV